VPSAGRDVADAVYTLKHTDLGQFATAGGIELTKVRWPTR
jgi:hypothetical protein